jgi:hypothetical protein
LFKDLFTQHLLVTVNRLLPPRGVADDEPTLPTYVSQIGVWSSFGGVGLAAVSDLNMVASASTKL